MFIKQKAFKKAAAGNAARVVLIAAIYSAIVFVPSNATFGQATGMQGDAAWNEYRTSGERTASGEMFDPESMTAASNDFPFDSLVRITRIDNGKTVVVRINDRTAGDEHIIHLSDAAARHIDVTPDQSTLIQLKRLRGSSLTVLRKPGSTLRTGSRRSDAPALQVRRSVAANQENRSINIISSARVRNEPGSQPQYTLQIGVFSSREFAKTFSGKISESWILPITVGGKAQYRVYFSRFREESPARVAQENLERQGHDSFLRTIES